MRVCAIVALLSLAACSGEGEAPNRAPPPAADGGGATDAAPTPGPGSSTQTSASGDAAEDPRPRVVFLGTSLTAGLGVDRAEARWPERVGALADSAGLPIEVVNAGVSGDTSAGGLRRLDWLLEDRVDLLVVELGANDGLRGQSPDALEDNLRTIVRRTRARWPDARVVLAGMEAPPNLGVDYTERFREIFPRVASDMDAALIPFVLDGVAGVAALNQADGIHPTPRGHDVMARNAWAVLEPILLDLHSRRPVP